MPSSKPCNTTPRGYGVIPGLHASQFTAEATSPYGYGALDMLIQVTYAKIIKYIQVLKHMKNDVKKYLNIF